ncbi:MAG: tRNA (N6-isopentenyl adenosine(37)-C2)-methylthiotransferase MiaB [Pseudomonadota bacterium]
MTKTGTNIDAKSAAPRKAFIKTYGCQMNVYDSERIENVLSKEGYEITASPEEADLTVLNTCHIREKAAEKVYSELGRLRIIQEKQGETGQAMKIAVAGCVAQAEGEEMLRRASNVDVVVGPQAYQDLPELLKQDRKNAVRQDFAADDKFEALKKASQRNAPVQPAAFLTIQEGCDKFCTFCVVPYTRGAEYSRPVADLLDEAQNLVARGATDITLLGQNVNAYHGATDAGGTETLSGLLYQLAEIEGIERLRYTTSHPKDMDEQLIAAHRDIPQVMPYLHLPVQSGSDRVLKAMNRRHGRSLYFDIVAKLRDARPDLALSSDIIVGFPGETDADFQDTLDLVETVEYAQCYSFKYSPRAGTPGAERDDQVPEEVKSERLAVLQDILNAQQLAFNQSKVGTTQPVLFERLGKKPGQFIGRTPYMQAVHIDVPYLSDPSAVIGRILDCHIQHAGPNSLKGALLQKDLPDVA